MIMRNNIPQQTALIRYLTLFTYFHQITISRQTKIIKKDTIEEKKRYGFNFFDINSLKSKLTQI